MTEEQGIEGWIPKTILNKDKENKLVEYIELMVHWGHPMTPM